MPKESKIAKIFGLNEDTWMRHANPWSVYTRYTVLPLIILAVWTRVWIGWWALIPVAVSIAWMFLNPVLFKKPQSTKNWASQSVLGERVWLNNKAIPIPKHHLKILPILNTIAGAGAFMTIYAMVVLNVEWAIIGTLFTYIGKSWFLDRMVWIFQDMKDYEEYKKWLY